jgi:hypothetical protein
VRSQDAFEMISTRLDEKQAQFKVANDRANAAFEVRASPRASVCAPTGRANKPFLLLTPRVRGPARSQALKKLNAERDAVRAAMSSVCVRAERALRL